MGEIKITSVESGKESVKEVMEGQQCGVKIKGAIEIEKGDEWDIFIEEEKILKH